MAKSMSSEATAIVEALGMRQHPEGGWYVETWRAPAGPDGARPSASAILFLLAAGERSRWHRFDAAEVWQWSGGAPLELRVHEAGGTATHRLGAVIEDGTVPQAIVPAGAWQSAESLGAWTLVGCIVSPAFDFAGFELAPPGWEPPAT
jgi:predicted cupin superfamily sugar epimerase